jgi:hypothetical protein
MLATFRPRPKRRSRLIDYHRAGEKVSDPAETVQRMEDAWWKSMILQVTLWSQP